jgi:hypothetical protein
MGKANGRAGVRQVLLEPSRPKSLVSGQRSALSRAPRSEIAYGVPKRMYEVSCYKLAPNGGGGRTRPGELFLASFAARGARGSARRLLSTALSPLPRGAPRGDGSADPARGTREGGTMSGTLVFSHKMMVQHIPARRVAVHLMWPLHSIH